MKERPILMSGQNPKLIMDGRKTQTRRLLVRNAAHKVPHPPRGTSYYVKEYETFIDGNPNAGVLRKGETWGFFKRPTGFYGVSFTCPYGVAGDRLYVRETHWRWGKYVEDGMTRTGRSRWRFKILFHGRRVRFEPPRNIFGPLARTETGWHKRPSIFLPKKLARIWLEITKVRVERLQDISDTDACREGCGPLTGNLPTSVFGSLNARAEFKTLWDSLHGKGAWEKNPWVWVLEFRKL